MDEADFADAEGRVLVEVEEEEVVVEAAVEVASVEWTRARPRT